MTQEAAHQLRASIQLFDPLVEQVPPEVNRDNIEVLTFYRHFKECLFPLMFVDSGPDFQSDAHQQHLSLRFFRSLALAASETAMPDDVETVRSLQRWFPLLSRSMLKCMIQPEDHIHLQGWIEEIVLCQQAFQRFFPPLPETTGEAKGFLYRISQEGILLGWLFGSMHGLHGQGMEEKVRPCRAVYERLAACALIGTEVKAPNGVEGAAVENELLRFAEARGIVNVGFDCPERDEGAPSGPSRDWLWQALEIDEKFLESRDFSPEEQELFEKVKKDQERLEALGKAYQKGDEAGVLAILNSEKPSEEGVEEMRQNSLLTNTHAGLQALMGCQKKLSLPALGFFCYGTLHVLDSSHYQQSLVKGLRELNWEIEQDYSSFELN
jgi:hypothetical protein